MHILLYLSNIMIPLFLFLVIGNGFLEKRDIYADFIDGAEEGLRTVIKILPTLIGLMVAVGVLRASGFLEFLTRILEKITDIISVPGEIVPLTVIRMFSSSAAVGLLLDIFKKYGTDSSTGWMATLILGATESVFYCMSIYYGAVKIKRTRYTLTGALLASIVGMICAVILVQWWGIL